MRSGHLARVLSTVCPLSLPISFWSRGRYAGHLPARPLPHWPHCEGPGGDKVRVPHQEAGLGGARFWGSRSGRGSMSPKGPSLQEGGG